MKINIRRNSVYFDVQIESNDISMNLGLLDKDEAITLAKDFILAAEELLPGYEYDQATAVLQAVRENV